MRSDARNALLRAIAWALLAMLPAMPGVTGETERPAHTGDAWVDAALADIDIYAGKHPGAFIDELVRYQSAPRALTEDVMSAGVAAGDVYFACAMAQALGRPCRELLEAWRADPDRDWGRVARQLEPAQARDALRRVRQGMVASYLRWARPLVPEAASTRPGSGTR